MEEIYDNVFIYIKKTKINVDKFQLTYVKKVFVQNVRPFFGHLETTPESNKQSIRIRI